MVNMLPKYLVPLKLTGTQVSDSVIIVKIPKFGTLSHFKIIRKQQQEGKEFCDNNVQFFNLQENALLYNIRTKVFPYIYLYK